MSHRKLNAGMAVFVFAVSFIVYTMTVAPTTSFWDCGEFIACSYILGVPHPPGAPLYVLLGRLFSMIPLGVDVSLDPAQIPGVWTENIALRVNMISPIFSAFTAMLTYLIIVRLILLFWKKEPDSLTEKITLYASGIVGALGFAFSDSQWFNSVEAEVYAGSMFFTAIVVWLILKWMDQAESAKSDRYILLIFYLVGLAIGVHLLNLLALPTIAMIIFARRYRSDKKDLFGEMMKMMAVAGLGGLTLYFGVNTGVVQGLPALMHAGGYLAVFLLLIAILVAASMAIANKQRIFALTMMSALLIIIGYSTYTAIYLRSKLDPAIDENNPETAEGLIKYLGREQYGEVPITPRRAPLWEYQIKKMFVRYFNWQFIGKGETLDQHGRIVEVFSMRGLWGIPFFLGLIGMFYHFFKDWRRALPIFTLFIMTGLAIIIYLNQDDPQPRERDYAYTGAFFAFALWIGIGVTALIEGAREFLFSKKAADQTSKPAASFEKQHGGLAVGVAGLMLVLVPGNMLFSILPGVDWLSNFREHNRKGDYVAFDYSYNILQSCEKDAIIFTNGDNDTFPLWFLQYVHNIRPDIRVVNLSLLNTDWYIKQLRDDAPKVAIRMSDASIEAIRPIEWKAKTVAIPVPKDIYEQEYQQALKLDPTINFEENPAVRIEVKPTYEGVAIRVQDLMILKILEDNQFRRPVYFAVTVSPENKIGLDPYMRMDGLAFRVLPTKIERGTVDPAIMWSNLNDKFRYRNLDNSEVYYSDNVLNLLQNYRSAFLHLAQYHLSRRENDEVVKTLDRMGQVMPEYVIPTSDFRINEAIGLMYAQAGRPEELTKRYRNMIESEYGRLTAVNDKLSFADYLNYRGQRVLAESLAQEVIKQNPAQREGYQWLARLYSMTGERDKAVTALEQLLARFPDDQAARTQLEQLRGSAPAAAPAPVDTSHSSN